MTTIAYDGVSKLVADRRRTVGDTPVASADKIVPMQHRGQFYLVAGAGITSHIFERVRQYLENPRFCGQPSRVIENFECTVMLVELEVTAPAWHFRVQLLTKDGGATDITHRPWGVGSGCDFAIGAMTAGVDARRAVEIACEYDVYSGDGLQEVDITSMMGRAAVNSAEFLPLYADAELPLSASMPFRSYNWSGEVEPKKEPA